MTVDGTSVALLGWALDPDTAEPIAAHAYLDGAWATATSTNRSRPDIAAVFSGIRDVPGKLGTQGYMCMQSALVGAIAFG